MKPGVSGVKLLKANRLNRLHEVKLHFAKHTQSNARGNKKQLAPDWMMEDRKASPPIYEFSICL